MSEAFNKYKVKISVLTKQVEKQNVDDTPVGLHVPSLDHSPLSLTEVTTSLIFVHHLGLWP